MLSRSHEVLNIRPVYDEWEWQEQGACREADSSLFFLEDKQRGSEKIKRERAAIMICNKCPVIEKCLKHALTVPENYGIWGGTTAEQRWKMRGKKERRHFR